MCVVPSTTVVLPMEGISEVAGDAGDVSRLAMAIDGADSVTFAKIVVISATGEVEVIIAEVVSAMF